MKKLDRITLVSGAVVLGALLAAAPARAEGVMFEEFLFWDNGEFMRQMGLGQ